VDITSGVGAAATVSTRELIARLFTTNSLVPTHSDIEFTSADDVGTYFGTTSTEYKYAVFYFGWISKTITRPQKISFARWVNAASAPQIYGAKQAQSLTLWNAVTAGEFGLTMGAFSHTLSGLDFSGAANLAAVAAIIQAAIRAEDYPVNFTGSIAISYPASFTGEIATDVGGDILTVSAGTGTIEVGMTVAGAGVAGGTTIAELGTGTGGNGTYILSTTSQTVASEAMTAGAAFNTLTVTAIDGTLAIGQLIAGSGITGSPTITALGTGTGGIGTYILSTDSLTISSEAMTAGAASALWSLTTVTYDSVRGSFNLTGGTTGDADISVTAGTGGNDIAAQLGWLAVSTIFSAGSAIQTVPEVLIESADASNNFGSFTFLPTLTEAEIVSAAEWNLARNNQFMYSVRCTAANASSLQAALADIGGVTITLAPIATEYPELVPMMILAATDYTALNSTVNYMFQFFNLTPSVSTNADADIYDALNINYYGQTQTAGQLLQFYQRGVMQGLPVDPADQNTYANEIWLKDAAGAALMTLLLALPKIPANLAGKAQITAILQSVINQALFNGTISVGKTLTEVQKLYISEQTGDPKAWYQVQNLGWWVTVAIVPYVESTVTKYKAVYTLIYSKDDVIRKIEGRDILI